MKHGRGNVIVIYKKNFQRIIGLGWGHFYDTFILFSLCFPKLYMFYDLGMKSMHMF
jgi:hypothetical protein